MLPLRAFMSLHIRYLQVAFGRPWPNGRAKVTAPDRICPTSDFLLAKVALGWAHAPAPAPHAPLDAAARRLLQCYPRHAPGRPSRAPAESHTLRASSHPRYLETRANLAARVFPSRGHCVPAPRKSPADGLLPALWKTCCLKDSVFIPSRAQTRFTVN